MTSSQNGWPIKPANRSPMTIGDVAFGDVLDGPVRTVLEYVARQYDATVQRLLPGQCGAYNPRKIPGSTSWSNHASATAIDCNWKLHPLHSIGTYSRTQLRAIEIILDACGGVVHWGGHWSAASVDEMHFEIHGTRADVEAVAHRLTQEDLPMDQATFNKLMDGWSNTPNGKAYALRAVKLDMGHAGGSTVEQAIQNTEQGVAELIKRTEPNPA